MIIPERHNHYMTVNITGIPEMLHSSLHEFCQRLKIILDTVLFFEYLFFPTDLDVVVSSRFHLRVFLLWEMAPGIWDQAF